MTAPRRSQGEDREFYVGYLDPAPPRLGRWLRALAVSSLGVAVAAAALVGAGQRRLPAATFEFGTVRTVTGFLQNDPYPSLTVPRGPVTSRFLLAGPGKRGAGDATASAVGRWVSLRGTLIFREGQTMVEVVPGSVTEVEQAPPPAAEGIVDLGRQYVEGEIVGAKCYLGVMNPGSGVVHRACARHCILGGIPPMLAVEHADGRTEGIVLVGPDGGELRHEVLELVGIPVGVTGRLVRSGPMTFLHANPMSIERLR